jgi:hypothetical protein
VNGVIEYGMSVVAVSAIIWWGRGMNGLCNWLETCISGVMPGKIVILFAVWVTCIWLCKILLQGSEMYFRHYSDWILCASPLCHCGHNTDTQLVLYMYSGLFRKWVYILIQYRTCYICPVLIFNTNSMVVYILGLN